MTAGVLPDPAAGTILKTAAQDVKPARRPSCGLADLILIFHRKPKACAATGKGPPHLAAHAFGLR